MMMCVMMSRHCEMSIANEHCREKHEPFCRRQDLLSHPGLNGSGRHRLSVTPRQLPLAVDPQTKVRVW